MKGRSGFTLLEVLVSLAIFVAAFASLSQLFTLGSRAAVQAALETQATVRAEAKMAEVLAGVESMEASEAMPFEDDPNWSWALAVNEGPHTDLFELTVTVAFQSGVGQAEMTYSLVRFRRDPQLALDIEEAAAAAEDGS